MPILESINRNFVWNVASYGQHVPYLTRYLSLLLAPIGRTERRVAAARYLEGLLLPEKRKFIRPLAERLQVDPQSLQQVIANSPWDERELWSTLRREVIPSFEPLDACIVHERAWAKQGQASVGVSNQRRGANGKKSRCQVSLELLLANGATAVPIASRLYIPENWSSESSHQKKADLPEGVDYSTKPALILELLTETIRDGIAPRIIVADCSYGNDGDFRSTLLRVGLEFFLEVDPAVSAAWDFGTSPENWNETSKPDVFPLNQIITDIPVSEWKNCSWTSREGMPKHTRLAIREVFLDSSTWSTQDVIQRLWLVIDWPSGQTKPYRCYLASFQQLPSLARCLRLSRHRSPLDQYEKTFDRDLDLACYQGRSWKGFHHHLVLAVAAYLFVLSAEMRGRSPFWTELREDVEIDPAISTETARLLAVLSRGTTSTSVVRESELEIIRETLPKYWQDREKAFAP